MTERYVFRPSEKFGEWQPIDTYDALKKKPKFAVFWFEEVPPTSRQKYGLSACVELSRTYGFRTCTKWIELPSPEDV